MIKKRCVPTLPKIFRPVTRDKLFFYLALAHLAKERGFSPRTKHGIAITWHHKLQRPL